MKSNDEQMLFNFNMFALLVLILIKQVYSEGLLISNEFGLYMTASSISGWPIAKVFSCNQDMFVDRKNQKIFGLIDKTNHGSLKKSYSISQPHWSISVRVDLYFISGMDPSDYVEIWMNNSLQRKYVKGSSKTDKFCSTTTDYYFKFYKNITHQANTFDLEFKSKMSSYSFGLSELYVVIDTCFSTCLTCSGPAENQCLSCFSGSTLRENKCLCETGYLHQQSCVSQCPSDFKLDDNLKMCKARNKSNCQNYDDSKDVCLQCKNAFFLFEGVCLSKCPLYTTQKTDQCIDNIPSNSIYLLKALFNNFVGESDVAAAGLVITGFEGDGKGITTDSGSLNSVCNKVYYIGGFMLAGKNAKIKRSFSGLPYHSQIRVGFALLAIDDWHYEYMKIRFDGSIGINYYVNFDITDDDLCGVSQFKDKVFYVNEKGIHQKSTLDLEIQAEINQDSFVASYGIRELYIILEKCSDHCIECDPDKCTKCENGYYVYQKICVTPCPSNTFIQNGYCIDCNSNCATCSGPNENNCLTCFDPKLLLETSKICVVNCPFDGFYQDGKTCKQCDSSCKKCNGGTSTDCTECYPSQILYKNQCFKSCPPNSFASFRLKSR